MQKQVHLIAKFEKNIKFKYLCIFWYISNANVIVRILILRCWSISIIWSHMVLRFHNFEKSALRDKFVLNKGYPGYIPPNYLIGLRLKRQDPRIRLKFVPINQSTLVKVASLHLIYCKFFSSSNTFKYTANILGFIWSTKLFFLIIDEKKFIIFFCVVI